MTKHTCEADVARHFIVFVLFQRMYDHDLDEAKSQFDCIYQSTTEDIFTLEQNILVKLGSGNYT